jgi:GNAT superfamily N-acetyltransferase
MWQWSRVVVCAANFLRVGWLGAQVCAFSIALQGIAAQPCGLGQTLSWFDLAALHFLRVVTYPLRIVPSSLIVPGPLMDMVELVFPSLTEPLLAALFLATNYQLGAIGLALVSFPARRAMTRCVHVSLRDKSIQMKEEFRAPVTEGERSAYHAIRRRVLFDLRGNGAAYDPNHPDEHRTGHHPFVLWIDDQPVGVIRVDIDGVVATFRRVAIRDDLQRRGYGRRLLEAAERFAKSQGCTRVESYVDPAAIPFYARCGFSAVSSPSNRTPSPRMTKSIA